jgi:phage terminase large subunit-like protein
MNLQEEILSAYQKNPLVWGWKYFPIHFRSKSPAFHYKIVREALKNKFFAVAAPRGSAKTTLIMFLVPMFWICFKKKHCIVLVGNTYKKAASALETMKKEFRENKILNEDFKVKIEKDAEGDSTLRHADGFEIHIVCKGAEQLGSIRGEKFGAYRPDGILVDDLEDDEMVKNPERREYLRELYEDALIPSVDVTVPFNVFVLGTILHDDSLIARLVSEKYYPEYQKLLYRGLNVIDGKEISLWEEKWTIEWLKNYAKQKPSTFAKEIQNDPVSGKEARFTKDQFRYWTIENLEFVLFNSNGTVISKGKMSECKAAIGQDLAWSERRDADLCVMMPGFITPYGDLLIDKYIAERGMRPDRYCELLFTMEQRLKGLTGSIVPIGFEKAMLEKVTHWILKQEMRKRDRWLITKEQKWESDKITRIETVLQAKYANSVVYHRQGMGELEHELLRFPSGEHDDLIDAEQSLFRLLEFPKSGKVEKPQPTDFEFWRKLAIDYKKAQDPLRKKDHKYVFGNKGKKKSGIPSIRGI